MDLEERKTIARQYINEYMKGWRNSNKEAVNKYTRDLLKNKYEKDPEFREMKKKKALERYYLKKNAAIVDINEEANNKTPDTSDSEKI